VVYKGQTLRRQVERLDSKNNKQRKEMDHPEQYKTNNKTLFDRFESEQNVDPIPMEDLKMELREEKQKHKTKDQSSSEEKYK
jgi:hypothetical protein